MSDSDDVSSCDGRSSPFRSDSPREWPGCRAPAEPRPADEMHASCPERGNPALERQFLGEYAKWGGSSQPDRAFLHLFARYVCLEGGIRGIVPNGSPRDTAYGLEKTREGLEFRIAHVHGACAAPEVTSEVEQRWSFNVATRELHLLEERPIA